MPTYETIGTMFRMRRDDEGLSQPELAAQTGVGVSTISRLERDESVPRAMNLAKLAMVLRIDPGQLENFGEDAAADILRGSLTEDQRSIRVAFSTLVDAEITLTKLGFNVTLAMDDDRLVLTCEPRTPGNGDAVATKSALQRERVQARHPTGERIRTDS